MDGFRIDRRTMLRGLAGTGVAGALASGAVASEYAEETDPTTRATFRAIVDAVVPETPDVADELGEEHEPGGLEIGLDAYLVEYVNTLFSTGNSALGELDDLRLAEVVARACDVAAAELLARGENEADPDPTRFEGGGPFASLVRDDRLRALALLDEKEIDTARLPGPVVEGTAGLIPQLVVAFTQVIYYSEWQGYDDVSAPPSEREFSETVDGERLQSWRQTEFPGVIDGAAALRGYLGAPDASLGEGRVWRSFADRGDGANGGPDEAGGGDRQRGRGDAGPDVRIYLEPGEFDENDYDTAGYEEPFDTGGEPASSLADGGSEVKRPADAVEEASAGTDEDLLERVGEQLFGDGGTGGDWGSTGGGDGGTTGEGGVLDLGSEVDG